MGSLIILVDTETDEDSVGEEGYCSACCILVHDEPSLFGVAMFPQREFIILPLP